MLPMNCMRDSIAYQMGDEDALPPQWTPQIQAPDLTPLRKQMVEQAQEAFGDLKKCTEEMKQENPFAAAPAQLNNTEQAMEDLQGLNKEMKEALDTTQKQLSERTAQNRALQNRVDQLKGKLRRGEDPAIAFVREVAAKGAAHYASK